MPWLLPGLQPLDWLVCPVAVVDVVCPRLLLGPWRGACRSFGVKRVAASSRCLGSRSSSGLGSKPSQGRPVLSPLLIDYLLKAPNNY